MTTPGVPYQESQDSGELRLQEPDPDHKQDSCWASVSELIRVSTEPPETLGPVQSFAEALALSALIPARDVESETAAGEHQRARAGDDSQPQDAGKAKTSTGNDDRARIWHTPHRPENHSTSHSAC